MNYDEKNAKQASELGYTANNRAGGDFTVTGTANYGDFGSVVDGENRAKADLLKARRLMEESDFTMDDLLGLSMADNDPDTKKAAQFLTQAQRHLPQSPPQYTPMSMPANAGWTVTENVATLTTGKRIKVFTVEDEITQMNTGKNYRVRAVAEKVAAVVNATNNVNDPRINMLNEAHDQYVTVKKNIAKAKKMLNEGKGDRQKLNRLQSELSQISARLGIA